MSTKKTRRMNKRLYVFIILLTLIAFALYFLIDLQLRISRSVIQTHTIDLGEIKRTIKKDVVVIKKSVPIISGREGILTNFYQQGDRIPKNAVICKVQETQSTENEIAKLEKLKMKIEDIEYNSVSNSPEIKNNQIQNDITYMYLDIQERIKNNDFRHIATLKSELISLIDKKNVIDSTSDYESNNLQELLNQKQQLERKLATDKTYIKSSIAGDLSYYDDGLEEKFSFKNMKNLTVKDLNSTNNNMKKIEKSSVKKDELIGYIVDNHYYYLAVEIEKSDIEAIKRDVKLGILIGDISLNAYFYDFYKDADGKFVGLFKAESEDFDFLRNRKESATITYNYAKGIVIPNSAIVDDGDKKAVYIVNEVGVAKFINLENILLVDDKNTVIQFSYDDFNDSSKIKLYDEVILAPKNIKDGQKVK